MFFRRVFNLRKLTDASLSVCEGDVESLTKKVNEGDNVVSLILFDSLMQTLKQPVTTNYCLVDQFVTKCFLISVKLFIVRIGNERFSWKNDANFELASEHLVQFVKAAVCR